MAEILRPNSNITQTQYTGGFEEINEVIRDDSDFAFGAVNSATPTLIVGLSDPVGFIGDVTCTVRWAHARSSANGTNVGGGQSIEYTCAFLEGSTVIASQTVEPGGWDQSEFTFSASSVTDWTNVRLRWTQTASGGGGGAQRGGAVSWAEVEIPEAVQTRYVLIT